MKPKFRILERDDGKFAVQSKWVYSLWWWHSHITTEENEKEARKTIEFIKRRLQQIKPKIKRIIEI